MGAEILFSTILTASIAAAGLLLVIYGIVIPITPKIAKTRLKGLRNAINNLRDSVTRLKDNNPEDIDMEELRGRLDSVEKIKKLPPYMSWILLATFLGYIISSILCIEWLIKAEPFGLSHTQVGTYCVWIFIISTISFGYIGSRFIWDMFNIIKKDFEQIKEEEKESKEIINPDIDPNKDINIKSTDKVDDMDLSNYPEFILKEPFDIVVGESAPAEDVISAIDIASSLEKVSKKEIPLAKLDTEIKIPGKNNLIVIGNPRDNLLISHIMGLKKRDLSGFEEGKAIIKLYKHDKGKIAIVIAGLTPLDTRRAAKVLANSKIYSLSGSEIEITGIGLTDISVSKVD